MVIGGGPTCDQTANLTVSGGYVQYSGILQNADPSSFYNATGVSIYGWFPNAPSDFTLGFYENLQAPNADWRLIRRVGNADYMTWYVERATGNTSIGNIGAGPYSPPAQFNVGTSSQFRVDASGNVTRINDVQYSFPASQGAASTVLTNNGSGTLSWSTAAAAPSALTATAANDLVLPVASLVTVSGNTQINAITTAGYVAGASVTLLFSGSPTVKNNTTGGAGTAPVLLAGSFDFATGANVILGLIYDGTQWQETFRKVP